MNDTCNGKEEEMQAGGGGEGGGEWNGEGEDNGEEEEGGKNWEMNGACNGD